MFFFGVLLLIRSAYVSDFLLSKRMEHHGLEWAGHESRKTPFRKRGPLDVLVVASGISAEVVTRLWTLWMVCVLTFFC